MKTTPKALKDLFVALGGDPSAVDGLLTVDVLNAIAEKYEGEGDATRIPDAIDAITAVADNIGGGGGESIPLFDLTVVNNSGKSITVDALDDRLVRMTKKLSNGESVHVYVPRTIDGKVAGCFWTNDASTLNYTMDTGTTKVMTNAADSIAAVLVQSNYNTSGVLTITPPRD